MRRVLYLLMVWGGVAVSEPAIGRPPGTPGPDRDTSGWILLFNGRDLTGWKAFFGDRSPKETGGVRPQPGEVVQVTGGTIHFYRDLPEQAVVPEGFLMTEKEYSHYRLRLEFRWGEKKFAQRAGKKRNSGLLFHARDTSGFWPTSIECQIMEGDVGDIYTQNHAWCTTTIDSMFVDPRSKRPLPRYSPAGRVYDHGGSGSRRLMHHVRLDSAEGWNVVEIVVRGSEAAYFVNGTPSSRLWNIRAFDPEVDSVPRPLTRGRILLQAEATEIIFRKIMIKELAPGEAAGSSRSIGAPARRAQVLLTPSGALNARIAGKDIREVPEFGFDDRGPKIVMSPRIPSGWTWCAALNVPTGGTERSFFFYDGWLFTTVEVSSGRRRQMYERDVSAFVKSNAHHVAYHRRKKVEDETVLLLVTDRRQRVRVELDPAFFGSHRVLEYEMEALQPKFINLTIVPQEFTVVPWHPERVERRTIPLNAGWRFLRADLAGGERMSLDDRHWDPVDLPHTWNAFDAYDTRNLRDSLDIMEMYYRGKSWYRKHFTPDPLLRGKSVSLRFLAANQVAEVWLNGEPLGRHTGGYLGFTFDVSKRLRWGTPNVLAVRVDNAYHYDIPPHTADYNFYGGLYREVELEVTHPVRVDRVVVTTPEVTPFLADVLTRTTVRNTSSRPITLRLVTSVISPYNEIVRSSVDHLTVTAGAHADMERHLRGITEPLLWDPDHPWMYRVSSTLYDERGRALDQTFEPLGFRWYRFDADSGFFLNGRPLKLRGVNLHQDHLNLGNAVGVDRKLRDLVLCKRMGANFIRLAHYPHHPAVLHFADSLGLMLWEEIPYVNTIGREAFMETAKQMLAGMIDRDRNHPSVILWGLGNEFVMPWLAEEDRGLSKQLTRELHTLAKVRDPGRLTVQAHNELIDTSIIGITDVQGRNRYYGWYEGTYDDLGPALDEEKRRFPDWKVIVSEYGAEGKYAYHVNRPETFDHSETYQMALHESSWQAIKDRPWVAGGTIWNMVDFGSFRKIGNIPHVNQKGMVTADRRPKGVYYYYQSQWTTDPMVHIVTDTWTHRSGPRGAPQQIKVYSNCDEVELLVDGQTAGRRPPPFVWNVRLIPGEHRLRAYGTLRGSTVSHDITMFYRETE